MTEQELLQMRDLAEAGKVQFKERANDRYDIGCEMVAFSLLSASMTSRERLMRCRMWNCKRLRIY